MFRSERMALCQIFLQDEAAYWCVSELGEAGLVQFRDVNKEVSVLQRKYVNDIRRCDEMERKLRYLEAEINKEDIPIFDVGDNPEAPAPKEHIDLEATLEKIETELREVNTNDELLLKRCQELTELKYILTMAECFFEEQEHGPVLSDGMETSLIPQSHDTLSLQLGFVVGVIKRDRVPVFERMLWRISRGNVLFKQTEIKDPLIDVASGGKVNKSVFIIFFQGEQLRNKVKKICEGFRASHYPCPDNASERKEMLEGVLTRLEDLNLVLNQSSDHRHRLLVNAARNLKSWFIKVTKIKAIYHALNLFDQDVTRKCLIAECWCAVRDIPLVQNALTRGTENSGSTLPSILHCISHSESPPTFNRTNKFTIGFQNIVNAYGVANYQEANPAPYTVITFPFLFAMMFGDAGHGLLMFLFALWMVVKEKSLIAKKSTDEIWNTFFNGRYIILLMGLFSVYTGLIYNDVFSKSLNIMGSSWDAHNASLSQSVVKLLPSDHKKTYEFGLDPVWQLSQNKILFTNSYKMKLSIIFGVSQMVFGILLSCWNHCHFKDYLSIICEFIPQMLFLLSIFGNLVALIFTKWMTVYENVGCAQSLLIMLINVFLFNHPDEPCSSKSFYTAQPIVESFLVILAGICVPWMLIVKPFVLRRRWLTGQYRRHGDAEEEFQLGDIIITQAIHTIEFCLGSISHTASYLRLWALSLAHSQLSEVLWNMVMKIAINNPTYFGAIILFPIFAFWAVLTIGVLLVMEGLSAFLHALRLHWVEFQSKFYKGAGYIFTPFSFKTILDTTSV